MERHRAARRQLVRSFEEVNALHELLECLRSSVEEKSGEIDVLEARRRAERQEREAVSRDLQTMRIALQSALQSRRCG